MQLSPPQTCLLLGSLGLLAYRGQPIPKRTLGHTETVGQAVQDKNWPYRKNNDATHELTRLPVRVTSSTNTTPKVVLKEEYDVIVVGGAASGLSVAACLKRRGVSNVLVVEKNENVGDIWRSRYHRLHLHDIIEECHLPLFNMPAEYPTYPTREQFATYLESYALVHRLCIQYLTLVKHAKQTPLGWEVSLENVTTGDIHVVKCRHLVLCNGVYNDPIIPKSIAGLSTFPGLQVHSSQYTNGTDLQLKDKRVLVVGFGNSAGEIAIDLVEHGAKPSMVIRSETTIVPRKGIQFFQELLHTHINPLLSIPFGWCVVGACALVVDPIFYVMQQHVYGGKEGLAALNVPLSWKPPLLHAIIDREPPVMDVGTIECCKRGLLQMISSEISEIKSNLIVFKNKEELEFDAIVWATGYNMFQGHRHFFDDDLFAKIGSGMQGLVDNVLTPGSEHPHVKGLWVNFGRLQMLNVGAQKLSWGIAEDLRCLGGENDSVDARDSWAWFAAKHAAVATAGYLYHQRSKL